MQIEHVDLADTLFDLEVISQECLFVFWWLDYPVGQAKAEGGKHSSASLAALAEKSVSPTVLALAKERTTSEATRATEPHASVSVVICTRDRPDDLARCLASFSTQTVTPDQIVVVDNASRDERTRQIATAAGVTYVREDRPGLDFARNAGALASSGEYVVYTDDDVQLHPRWLQRMIAAFDRPEVMAVTGLVLPAELETDAQEHFERFWCFGRGYERIDYGEEFFSSDQARGCPAWEVGAGASMAFRSAVFQKIGLFDERLDVGQAGCSGDSEYWHRVLTHHGVCRYEPSAVVFHYHRREMMALSRQIYSYMRGHSAALLVQYERSGNRGNLRRALFWTPYYYVRRILRTFLKGRNENDLFLKAEVQGYMSGLLFYLRAARPPRTAVPPLADLP